MTFQASVRNSLRLVAPLKAFGCIICFLCVVLNAPAANANPVASASQAPRYLQRAADASGRQLAGEGKLEAHSAPEQTNFLDHQIRSIWQRRRTRGPKQKEVGQSNPEKISVEGQRDLIDILNPKKN